MILGIKLIILFIMPVIESKYNDYVKPFHQDITKWIGEGVSEEEVCRRLGVSSSTFLKYKKRYPLLKKAVIKGRQRIKRNVVSALIKKCLGFHYEEEREVIEKGKIVTLKTTRYAPPDFMSIAFYLINRYSQEWTHTSRIEGGTGPVFINITSNVPRPDKEVVVADAKIIPNKQLSEEEEPEEESEE